MPDAPDDYGLNPSSTIDNVDDVGELAARLGSPVNMYRSGNVIFVDDGSHGSGFYRVLGIEERGSVISSPKYAYSSGYSLLVETGDQSGDYVNLVRQFYYTNPGNIGLFTPISNLLPNCIFDITLDFTEGGIGYSGILRYDPADNRFSYYTSSLSYEPLVDVLYTDFVFPFFMPIKLSIDTNNKTYHYAWIAGVRYDLSSVPLIQTSPAVSDRIYASIDFLTTQAGGFSYALGACVLTVGEP